jgi:hypothetical protein
MNRKTRVATPPFILPFLLLAAAASAQSNLDPTDHWGWGGNLGWLDFRAGRPDAGDGVLVCDTFLSGYVWSPNLGWIHLGNGLPADAIHYRNDTHADYGVNVDADGNLSGLAWAANAGWINFGWALAADPNRPRFNLYSGRFLGFAWSPNCGWINLGVGRLLTRSIACQDRDRDGLSDAWEMAHAGNLTLLAASGDADGDGLSDQEEFLAGTDPRDATSALRITAFAPAATGATITWTSRPSRQYQIYESATAAGNPWSLSLPGQPLPGSPGAVTQASVPNAAGHAMFYRVAVLPILAP